jgi:hypothetical protein
MTLHALTRYLIHSFKAKGRHGTHSPFVYALTEDVLLAEKTNSDPPALFTSYSPAYARLLSAIIIYLGYRNIRTVMPGERPDGNYDALLLPHTPEQWEAMISSAIGCVNNDGMAVITGIHNDTVSSAAWARVCGMSGVTMSIDLYGIGLLLFKEEFKERQHFIMKRRL